METQVVESPFKFTVSSTPNLTVVHLHLEGEFTCLRADARIQLRSLFSQYKLRSAWYNPVSGVLKCSTNPCAPERTKKAVEMWLAMSKQPF